MNVRVYACEFVCKSTCVCDEVQEGMHVCSSACACMVLRVRVRMSACTCACVCEVTQVWAAPTFRKIWRASLTTELRRCRFRKLSGTNISAPAAVVCKTFSWLVCACVRMCVRACMSACVSACARASLLACMRTPVRVCACRGVSVCMHASCMRAGVFAGHCSRTPNQYASTHVRLLLMEVVFNHIQYNLTESSRF